MQGEINGASHKELMAWTKDFGLVEMQTDKLFDLVNVSNFGHEMSLFEICDNIVFFR